MKKFVVVLAVLGVAGAAVYLGAWSSGMMQASAYTFPAGRGAAHDAAVEGVLEAWLKRQGYTRVPEGFLNGGIFASTKVVVDRSDGLRCSVHWTYAGPSWLMESRKKEVDAFLEKLKEWCAAYEAGAPRPR